MWYTAAFNKNDEKIMKNFGKMLMDEITKKSPTAPDDDIHIWVDLKSGKWFVSAGDWTQTTFDIIEKIIRRQSYKLYKELGASSQQPFISWNAEAIPDGKYWSQIL